MNYKTTLYVDDNQNIVTRIEIIESPEEYLQRNGQVYNFSQTLKPGYKIMDGPNRLISTAVDPK